jgi:hypothetical protein
LSLGRRDEPDVGGGDSERGEERAHVG